MKLLVTLILVFGVVCQARHIHPGTFDTDKIIFDEMEDVKSDLTIDGIRSMKPTGFVPLNSDLFFKTYEPCEDGYQRDVLGICREVWD